MQLDAKTLAQSKAFAAQLRATTDKIKSGHFPIDGSGDTLTNIIGMVVQNIGAEAYEDARKAMSKAVSEKDKIVALMESVVSRMENNNKMGAETVSILNELGASGIKWV
jgi:hypothetical protein